jgi:hypothetical protein
LNEEFLIELGRTGDLTSLATRIPNARRELNQPAIQVNNTDITNTVVNLTTINTAKKIQEEINTITNTNVRNLDALPNQITRVRERLKQNH